MACSTGDSYGAMIPENLCDSSTEEEVAKVYRTVVLAGKTDKGKDIYKDVQETTADMWKRWIINPHSIYKIYFDMFVGIFILFSAISIPYRLGLHIKTDAAWSAVDAVNELVFGIDIVLCFFTAYEQSDYALHTVPKNIARRYIKTWFLIDYMGCTLVTSFESLHAPFSGAHTRCGQADRERAGWTGGCGGVLWMGMRVDATQLCLPQPKTGNQSRMVNNAITR